jgi:hypothetical protein
MNLINKIQRAMTGAKMLKVEIYDEEEEVVFAIWENETPILVNPSSRTIKLVAINDIEYSAEDLEELSKIMKIISINWDEIDEWVAGWNE